MTKTVPMIGIEPDELPWVRSLVGLLRHTDPAVRELTRQAVLFLEDSAVAAALPGRPRTAHHSTGMDRVS